MQKCSVPVDSLDRIGAHPDNFIIRITEGDVIGYANLLYETGCFVISEPSFLREIKLNNHLYNDQWSLHDQNYGINVEPAWKYTSGKGITVAVIDDGCYMEHPDLECNLVNGYNSITGENSGETYGLANNHGTLCAGIIAACDNNVGIKGVAYNATIYPIKAMGNGFSIADEYFIRAFERATSVADVINCSWGNGDPISSMLASEIRYAINNGRNGKGCVVVFSSGNDDQNEVNSQARCDKGIIAVGAINKCGKRISPKNMKDCGDPFAEDGKGSNYGSMLDMVAPGERIKSTNSDESYYDFSMTSAAAPHVAGVAALVLSANQNLTASQVQSIINSTCRKLPDYSFSNNSSHPDGTWNEEVGHGLVDAEAAVKKAIGTITIIGSDLICDEATYRLSSIPTGATVAWSYEGYDVKQFPQPLTITRNGDGSAVYKRGTQRYMDPIDTVRPPVIMGRTEISRTSVEEEPYTGKKVITATIKLNGTSVTLKKAVSVGTVTRPEICLNGFVYNEGDLIVPGRRGQTYTFSCTNIPAGKQYWEVNIPGTGARTYAGVSSVSATPTAGGTLSAKVYTTDGCPDDNYAAIGMMINPIFIIDPVNPVNPGQPIAFAVWTEGGRPAVPASAMTTDSEDTQPSAPERVPYEGEYTIELWGETVGLVTRRTFDTPVAQMPTDGITQPGIYYLRLIIDGELRATEKVIIL